MYSTEEGLAQLTRQEWTYVSGRSYDELIILYDLQIVCLTANGIWNRRMAVPTHTNVSNYNLQCLLSL